MSPLRFWCIDICPCPYVRKKLFCGKGEKVRHPCSMFNILWRNLFSTTHHRLDKSFDTTVGSNPVRDFFFRSR